MSLLQVPPTSLIHKIATNYPNMVNSLYIPFIAYLFWRINSIGQEDLDTFLKGQNVPHDSVKYPPAMS